jgi:hypothetical protein
MIRTILLLSVAASPFAVRAAIVSSGSTTIPGTFSFDFDAGVVINNFITDPAADVFWEQFTSTTRAVTPVNGATIVNLGVTSFAGITLSDLTTLVYGTSGISGSDGSNALVPGDVFAVHTNAGNYAKALVTGPFDTSLDNGLPMEWVTYSPQAVPEPDTAAGVAVTLGVLAFARRRGRRLT